MSNSNNFATNLNSKAVTVGLDDYKDTNVTNYFKKSRY